MASGPQLRIVLGSRRRWGLRSSQATFSSELLGIKLDYNAFRRLRCFWFPGDFLVKLTNGSWLCLYSKYWNLATKLGVVRTNQTNMEEMPQQMAPKLDSFRKHHDSRCFLKSSRNVSSGVPPENLHYTVIIPQQATLLLINLPTKKIKRPSVLEPRF